MAITMEEKYGSRDGSVDASRQSGRLTYILRGSEDEPDIWSYVIANTAALKSNPLGSDPLERGTVAVKEIADGVWEASVDYLDPNDRRHKTEPETGDITIEVDTSGGTQHVTQSLRTVQQKAGTVIDSIIRNFEGAVNVRDDGRGCREVEGTDIVVPTLRFSITKMQAPGLVDLAYVKSAAQITGKMNNAEWNGFAAGELLFMGFSARQRNRGDWECRYEFAYSENLSSITIGDPDEPCCVLSGKKGWDYLWVYYVQKEADNGNIMVPAQGNVERMYEEANFGALLI